MSQMNSLQLKLLLFSLFGILSFQTFAQGKTGSMDGIVLDSTLFTPVEFALVSVHKIKDSTLVTSIYTNEKGEFILEDVPYGKYYIRIFTDEYKTKFLNNVELNDQKPLRKFGKIALVTAGNTIAEVEIKGDKNPLTTGIDKKTYNVADDISLTGGNANDVLNNIPSIEIDQDGKVSLRGDGNVTILIDGRPSNMTGGGGKSFLDGLPASSIERIEIVTNPSAKYDPDGTSGIINIVLKKNVKRGLNGNFQLSGATGNAYNASAGLSMRNTKMNVYGNYAFDYRDGYRNNFTELKQIKNDSNYYFDQKRYGGDINNTHTARIGMDLYMNDRNTLSWNVSGNTGDRQRTGEQSNIRYTDYSDTTQFWNRTTSDPTKNYNLDGSAGLHHDFKGDKGTIDWNVYQSMSQVENTGDYQSVYTFPSDSNYRQTLNSTERSQFTTASMDIIRFFGKNIRTESGLKMIHRQMSVNSNMYTTNASGQYAFDSLGYFNYEYTERIYSAYGIAASSYKKFNYQVGLRLEQSFQEPRLLSTGQNFLNKYFNVFPSAHVRYKIKEGREFSFGYSKRINRPNSESLNPFTSYADPFNLRRGNPALTPEYIHSFDVGFEKTGGKLTFTAAAYQRFSFDVISRVKEFNPDGSSVATQANIDQSISTGGELVFQYKPYPKFRSMLSANGNYIRYMDKSNTIANFNKEGFVLSFKGSATFELMNKTLVLQANGSYGLPAVTPSGIMHPRGSLNLSADKSFKDGKWGVGMRITDVFNTQGMRFYLDQPLAQQYVEFKWLTRRVYVSIRYRFGKVDMDKSKATNSNGNNGGGGFDF